VFPKHARILTVSVTQFHPHLSLASLHYIHTSYIQETKNELQSSSDHGQHVVSSVSGSDVENADVSARKKARVSFSMDVASQSSPMSTSDIQSKDVGGVSSKDVSGPTATSNKSARESQGRTARAARSLRRQANGVKEVGLAGARSQRAVPFKKHVPGTNMEVNSSSSLPKRKADKTEEVVKVKLNTGTLLLYKGQNRRAVFLRRC